MARLCAALCLLAACCALAAPGVAAAPGAEASARDSVASIYRELVDIDTTHSTGDTLAAAQAMAKRLLDAGFEAGDVEVMQVAPRKGNLVARYRGTGGLAPVLLLAHLDVVEARKEDWSGNLDPLKLTERDGYFYGRGSIDDKAMAAIFVANLVRYRREGYRPKADVIVALTADEETGGANGVAWLIAHRRDAIAARVAVNEGGGGSLRSGKPFMLGVGVSEKMFLSFDFEATNPGGHSSVPRRDNAIYDLAAALGRLAALELPVRLSPATRASFLQYAALEREPLASALESVAREQASEAQLARVSRVPRYNAQLRTTCVATRLEGGHADNALPQRARATVNCRLLPGEDPQLVLRELERVAGERVAVRMRGHVRVSTPSDVNAPAMAAIRGVAESLWPGVPVVPIMGTGATDGSRLRNAGIPVYGVSGIFVEHGEDRIHGRDERVGVAAFFDAAEFLYRLGKALADGK